MHDVRITKACIVPVFTAVGKCNKRGTSSTNNESITLHWDLYLCFVSYGKNSYIWRKGVIGATT